MNGNDQASPWGEYADLDGYGQQAAPQHQFMANTESLSPGDYECEFVRAALEMRGGHRVCATQLRLLSHGGRAVEHVYWLNRQEAVNGFMAEMTALGFPSQTWGTGPGKTPLSHAIPDCVAKLKGLRFRATKSVRNVPARPAVGSQPAKEAATYHDWFIGGRTTGAPMPPVASAPATQLARNGAGVPAPVGAEQDIPF